MEQGYDVFLTLLLKTVDQNRKQHGHAQKLFVEKDVRAQADLRQRRYMLHRHCRVAAEASYKM